MTHSTTTPASSPAPASSRTGGPVLVTGASGSVGREVVEALVATGVPVRATGRDPATVDDLTGRAPAPVTDRVWRHRAAFA